MRRLRAPHALALALVLAPLAASCTVLVGDRVVSASDPDASTGPDAGGPDAAVDALAGADLAGASGDLAGAVEDLAGADLAAGPDLAAPSDLATVDLAQPDLSPVGPSQAQSSLVIMPSSVTADGSSNAILSVTVRDALGSPVVGQPVALSATGSSNTITPANGITNAQGVFNATLASSRAELKTVTATVAGFMLEGKVTFVAGGAQQGSSQLSVSPGTVEANGVAAATLTVTVKDGNGNPVSGSTVTLSTTGSGNTLSPTQGTTDAQGVVTATLASTVAELKTVTASVGSFMLMQAVGFVAGPPSAATSTVVASPSSGLVANGAASAEVTATLKDAKGNPVSGVQVSFTATGGGTTFTPPSLNTDGSGVAKSTLRATTAGGKQVSATASGVPLTQMPTVTFSACPSPAPLSATPTSGSTVGGTSLYHPVCALPTDAAERVFGFTLASQGSVVVDRGASFAGAVTDLRPAASGCSIDAQSQVCTSRRYLYCPTLASGAWDVVVDGANGATGGFAISLASGPAKGSKSYGVVSTPPTFASIVGGSGASKLIADSVIEKGTAGVALPFDFTFFGKAHTAGETLTVFQSGYVAFGATPNTLQNVCLATAALPAESISPFWGRLASRSGVRGNVWVSTQGTAPNRIFTVEWNQMDAVDATDSAYECIMVSIQVLLYEATGEIEFRYLPDSEDRCAGGGTPDQNYAVGGHSTIGLQGATSGTLFEQASCATASGVGPTVVGTCTRPGGNNLSPCTATKGFLFVPPSAGCP